MGPGLGLGLCLYLELLALCVCPAICLVLVAADNVGRLGARLTYSGLRRWRDAHKWCVAEAMV